MFQPDHSTAVVSRPVASPPGVPGWFTDGNPSGGQSATILQAEFLNDLTGNIIEVLTQGGVAPTKERDADLYDAIVAIIQATLGASGGDFAIWPAGVVVPVMVAAPPQFTLSLNGQNVSRATFAKLFTAWGTAFGVGDGATTFTLADLRGEFLRGWDNAAGNDPDAAARTDRGDGTVGDNVGTKQTDDIKSHTHPYKEWGAPGSSVGWDTLNHPVALNESRITSATGGNETRSRNVSVQWVVATGGE